MADTVVITCVRAAQNQTITVTLPEPVVQLLDAIAAGVQVPDPTNPGQTKAKYSYGLNVIWQDAIERLVPLWAEQFKNLSLQSQMQQITQGIAQSVADISVVGP